MTAEAKLSWSPGTFCAGPFGSSFRDSSRRRRLLAPGSHAPTSTFAAGTHRETPNSFLFLVAMPGAPSSVLVPSNGHVLSHHISPCLPTSATVCNEYPQGGRLSCARLGSRHQLPLAYSILQPGQTYRQSIYTYILERYS